MLLDARARTVAVALGLGLAVGLGVASCRSRNLSGDLRPPKGAQPFPSQHRTAFDDDFTPQAIELSGRAPNDVLDQRLFTSRLGHADLVVLCQVNEVWGKGKYQGRKEQFVDLSLGEVLLGEIEKDTNEHQMFVVSGEGEVSTSLQGSNVIVFLKWAPGEIPPYHHHLMPAQDEAVEYIRALVKMAKDEGMIDGRGRASKRERRSKRKGGNDEKKGGKKKSGKKSRTPALDVKDEP